jgi:hypothetical protein
MGDRKRALLMLALLVVAELPAEIASCVRLQEEEEDKEETSPVKS